MRARHFMGFAFITLATAVVVAQAIAMKLDQDASLDACHAGGANSFWHVVPATVGATVLLTAGAMAIAPRRTLVTAASVSLAVICGGLIFVFLAADAIGPCLD